MKIFNLSKLITIVLASIFTLTSCEGIIDALKDEIEDEILNQANIQGTWKATEAYSNHYEHIDMSYNQLNQSIVSISPSESACVRKNDTTITQLNDLSFTFNANKKGVITENSYFKSIEYLSDNCSKAKIYESNEPSKNDFTWKLDILKSIIYIDTDDGEIEAYIESFSLDELVISWENEDESVRLKLVKSK